MSDLGVATASAAAPALPHLIQTGDGTYALAGTGCRACGVVVEGDRLACPACGETRALERVRLSTRGAVHAHTVVHRSYPGIETPFVAVIVDLDGGATVRGTLVDVDPLATPPARVEMVFRETTQRDADGRPFLCYVFVAEGRSAS